VTAIEPRSTERATRPAAISPTKASARSMVRAGYAAGLSALFLAASYLYGASNGSIELVSWLVLR
jgi:hypothetical protein